MKATATSHVIFSNAASRISASPSTAIPHEIALTFFNGRRFIFIQSP